MNDLKSVRGLYDDPPAPDRHTVNAARLRMTQDAPPATRRVGRRPLLGLGGIIAAGTAAAVGISLLGGDPSGVPGKAGSVGMDGKQAVLAAAAKVELLPTGTYWFSDQIQGQSYMVRAKTGPYAVVGAHSETFSWAGVKKGTGSAFYGRDLPAKPLTEQDEIAWRRAGSPKEFRVWSNDHYSTYAQKASKWEVDDPDPAGGGTFFMRGIRQEMTTEQILRLPSDPATLARMFLSPATMPKAKPRSATSAEFHAAIKLHTVSALLMEVPLQPRVRAGLMRALAAQPGFQSLGSATDPLGRPGVALAVDDTPEKITGEFGDPQSEQGEYRSRSELIFDRDTGMPLARQQVLTKPGGPYKARRPGFVINYWLVRDLGWTDTKPKPPTRLPF